jgi:hypothetical protein
MKRLAYTIFAALLVFAATLKASAQSEQTREVSGFNSIGSAGPFDVHVNINGTESLKISASPDIINEIETVVEDGRLEIKFKHHHEWGHEHTGKVDVYVTAKSLSGLANSGSGYIKVDGVVSGENVRVSLSGSGNITSSVKSGDLHIAISGSGNVNINGSANETNIAIAGSGDVMGKGLKTGSASVSIAGSGSAYFAADKNISAHISGSGNVIYSGNANVDSRTAGSGRVSKED